MSWHENGKITAEVSARNGEIMVSASDVVSWLRACGPRVEAHVLADLLAGEWLETAWARADRDA
jgi:hypothetical protein